MLQKYPNYLVRKINSQRTNTTQYISLYDTQSITSTITITTADTKVRLDIASRRKASAPIPATMRFPKELLLPPNQIKKALGGGDPTMARKVGSLRPT